jgi:hypothetical protein
MASKPQLKPIDVFEANIGDAERLIGFARALENKRRFTRLAKKRSVGRALGFPAKQHDALGCVESRDLFIVIKPSSAVKLEHFAEKELRPLLRQAVVAISAAVESYVAEKACSYASAALRSRPDRLKLVTVSLDAVIEIESRYQRRGVGHRAILKEFIEREASPSPTKIGIVFSTVGQQDLLKKVDTERGLARGVTAKQLEALYARRNKIAHTGDRTPTSRAALSLAEVEVFLENATATVKAMESVLP